MTAVAPSLWNSRPGWGICTNLLPPEVIAARRLRVVRKLIVVGLALVVLLGAGGYVYAMFQQRGAESDLTSAQNATSQLEAQQHKYSSVVDVASAILAIQSQLATAMSGDVDTTAAINAIRSKLQRGGVFTQLQLTLGSSSQASGTPSAGSPAPFDTSGQTPIGSVTLTGTVPTMPQVATLVTDLGHVPGVIGVYPTSQQNTDGKKVQFTITLTITDKLLTHRFDSSASSPSIGVH